MGHPFFARSRPFLLTLGATVVIAASPSQAQLDHTAIYKGLSEFLCGPNWDQLTSCLDRDPPLSDNEIADLGAELVRLEAISAFEDEIEEADLIESGFLRLCEDDPARCLGWVHRLGRSGTIDGDMDGVLDGVDTCPGTTTTISRAQAILLAQSVALLELQETLGQVRTLLIQGVNGTLGSQERFMLGESVIPLYFDLFSIANKREDERFLFGGKLDSAAPFEISGTFDDAGGPIVTYTGASVSLDLAIGPSDDSRPVAFPGSRPFMADLDLDGTFPDAPGVDLFEFVKNVRESFHANDLVLLREALQIFEEAFAAQIAVSLRDNSATFAATKRVFPSPESSEVDLAGCSQAQFCSGVAIAQGRDNHVCAAMDFMNDEPLSRFPRDCRVERKRGRDSARCVVFTPSRKAWRDR